MHATTLIIGGCRSGKSSHALALGEKSIGRNNLFVATCQPHDDEMIARINHHRLTRGRHWQTVEEPLNPDKVILDQAPAADVIVIDCLTLWISNMVMAGHSDDRIMGAIKRLSQAAAAPACPVFMVTNEVGLGIVPENAVARRFRDLAGWCNQNMAAACQHVIWMVAGIAVPVKSGNS